MGYVLAEDFLGKGITTIATKIAIETGFKELAVLRIEAFVDPKNIASQRVLQKVGMTYEGLLKNYVLFKGSIKDRYIYAATI